MNPEYFTGIARLAEISMMSDIRVTFSSQSLLVQSSKFEMLVFNLQTEKGYLTDQKGKHYNTCNWQEFVSQVEILTGQKKTNCLFCGKELTMCNDAFVLNLIPEDLTCLENECCFNIGFCPECDAPFDKRNEHFCIFHETDETGVIDETDILAVFPQ